MKEIKKLITEEFVKCFNTKPEKLYSCGGRFEILGNHTDHNHGLCLAATCDLEIYAGLTKRDDMLVDFSSIDYQRFTVDLNDLEIKKEEKGTSQGLVRGVARYLVDHGYKVGGFNAASYSTIFKGAGVSSSAAFELLIAEIFNSLFNGGKIKKILLCKAGQYAENEYFGKKSGLLDQIGVGYGSIVGINFKNIESPKVKKIKFPFKHLHFVIVNTGGSHAELSDLYSSIPMDMYSAAKKMGHEFLIEGSMKELNQKKDLLTVEEYRRALHFYEENERVKRASLAIMTTDESTFLDMINQSRLSSTNNLRNMQVGDNYEGSPLEACHIAMDVMGGKGAAKINGGGFAGSIICVVPTECLKTFIKKMSEKYGENNVKEVHVKKEGPSLLKQAKIKNISNT